VASPTSTARFNNIRTCSCAVIGGLTESDQKGNAKEINQLRENGSNKRQHKASIGQSLAKTDQEFADNTLKIKGVNGRP
jgi:hypothetical protein